jgi:hypothetical protein
VSSAHRPAIPFTGLNSRSDRVTTANTEDASRGWKLPSPGKRLLGQLQELSALVLEGAQTLHEAGLNGERTVRVEALARRAAEVDRTVLEKVSRALVTPLDAEDIRHVSGRLRRVLEEQVRMARVFNWAEQSSVDVPIGGLTLCGLHCASELSAAAKALPDGQTVVLHARNVRKQHRSAKLLLREWRVRMLASESIPKILRCEQLSKRLSEVFGEYALAARTLERVLFKNG